VRDVTPLAGRSILLTRPESRARGLARRLRAAGARPTCRAVSRLVAPRDASRAREAIAELGRYHWIVFTSANGVRFFGELLAAAGGSLDRVEARLAVVGPGTAAALSVRGREADLVARESRAEGLAEALVPLLRPGNRTVLWVRPERAREVLGESLAAQGARVDGVPFYRNVAAPDVEETAREVASGAYDAVTLAAPSAFAHLRDATPPALRERLREVRFVAIGNVTATALDEAGLPAAAVAREPTDEGLFRALERALRR
jgi:uroporphyrinogen-III synthase